jgi:hypothetical protein
MMFRRIETVSLYDEGAAEVLDIGEVAEYLRGKLETVPVEVRGNPFTSRPEKGPDYARKLASIKIQDASRRIALEQEPLYGEISYEERRILGKTKAFGVLYEGFQLQRVFLELIAWEERSLGVVHIFFTNRLFATWEEGDKRYHARTSVYGVPSVISTTGLVEAPAKPREYYLLKQRHEMLGKDLLGLKERFKGRFVDYDDERLTEVMKGYVMQAVFYHLVGNPFCEDKGCRLYNAHWQEELVFAQLESGYEFCEQHAKILDSLRGK